MTEGIIIAFIGFAGTVAVHYMTARTNASNLLNEVKRQSKDADAAFDKALSVYAAQTDAKIEELTREVREHNNFARRVPIIESKIENIEKKVGL